MMKKLLIVGAGGFGRELLQWIKDINNVQQRWTIGGFIDDNLAALDGIECEYGVISTISDYIPERDCLLALGIANPQIKEKVVSQLLAKGCEFTSVIHPTAIIGDHNTLGKGLVIYPKAVITVNAHIGDFATLLSSSIGHDAHVDDFCTISAWCDITGGVHLGKRVYLATGVKIVPKCQIGDDTYVCAGSVLLNNAKPNSRLFGIPAKRFSLGENEKTEAYVRNEQSGEK